MQDLLVGHSDDNLTSQDVDDTDTEWWLWAKLKMSSILYYWIMNSRRPTKQYFVQNMCKTAGSKNKRQGTLQI